MVVFGTRGRSVAGVLLEGVVCSKCGTDRHRTFGLMRYFHLFWVPMFPTSKKAGMECAHCQHTLTGAQVPPELSQSIKQAVFNRKNTLPMFAGLLILVLLFGAGYVKSGFDHRQDLVYLETPQAQDLYLVNFAKIDPVMDYYGVMKVHAVNGSSVEVLLSTHGYNKRSGPRKDISSGKAAKDSYYGSEIQSFDLSVLKELQAKGAILSVTRS